ncbi:MAG: hypothetical protein IKV46_02940 [Bacteroidales bacterium]|jgi:cell division protein FtsQ|nr:hypothetical protein [Bacteroidales bacterium]
MNKRIKLILIIFAIFLLVIIANVTIKNLNVSKVDIEVIYKGSDQLITKNQVSILLNKKYGSFTNYKRKEIDEEEIEMFLKKMNFVHSVDVYLDLLGVLKVSVVQNNPILRIINNRGEQYYIDDEGNVCNILKRKSANVLIVNGDIGEALRGVQKIDSVKTPIIYNTYIIASKLRQNGILYNQIDQIYYDKKTKYELLPKVGDYVIRFGGMENIDDKFLKLDNLYKEGFLEFGWDNYSEVKLEFDGQVVCVRK